MSLWKIAWRSIQQRGLASLLTTISMASGVMLVVAVLSILGVVSESFQSNSSLGYNMIVGAKGGKLQLTLNTVYYLSQPVENIPYSYYLEFFTAERRRQETAEPGDLVLDRDGRFGPFVQMAIPLCLGDYYDRFRVVGTTPALFDELRFGPDNNRQFEFREGRNFQTWSEENGFYEAVVGYVVASEKQLKLGDKIQPSHGAEDGDTHDEGFSIVGILQPTGTPNDRAVFVNMEGFYLMDNHAKPIEEEGDEAGHGQPAESKPAADSEEDHPPVDTKPADATPAEATHAEHDQPGHDHAAQAPASTPLPIAQREVTAILIRTISPLVTPGLENRINEGREAQAVLPVREIYNLFDAIIDPVKSILLALTATICIVSGIGILVSIYNSMNDRRHEIAVMRALGASRGNVMSIILIESVLLSLGGGLLGWATAHGAIALASPLIEARTGVSVGFFDFAPPVSVGELLKLDPFSVTVPGIGITITDTMSPELLLIPALILLAILVGFLPAISAYRTDVAKSL